MNGVIETATGNLIRAGYTDFTAGDGEEIRTDVPDGAITVNSDTCCHHRWTGSEWETTQDLVVAKSIRNAEIDAKTRYLIGKGFVYDGRVFSLSEQAQMNIVGLKTPVDMSWITFPHKMSTMNDDDPEYELADVSAYYAVYATAVGTIKTHMDSGRALKKLVAACTTVAEVEAIADTR